MAEIGDVINTLKTQFDSVQSSMKSAQDELAKTKQEHEVWKGNLAKLKQDHAAKVSELEAKKVAADRAAEENARRIKLNNDQVAELERIRAELDKRTKELDKREAMLNGLRDDATKRSNAIDLRDAEVRGREQEINRRYAKMKEAIG